VTVAVAMALEVAADGALLALAWVDFQTMARRNGG
jgi:hypothetical protein